jgi:hypothetical protein
MTCDAEDVTDLARMMQRLRALVARLAALPDDLGPVSIGFREIDGRAHRIVVPRPRMLTAAVDLAVVAFFGTRRSDVNGTHLHSIDNELIDLLADHSEMVAYCSLSRDELRSGNMVLATSATALETWSRSARHQHAAHQLAPAHYSSIRIHRGTLPGGVLSQHAVELTATRQLAFSAA